MRARSVPLALEADSRGAGRAELASGAYPFSSLMHDLCIPLGQRSP